MTAEQTSRHIGAALLLFLSVPLAAEEVYRTVDENGVVTFSDVETAGAEPVNLPPVVEREDALAEQQAVIDQQLAVAKSLEESRLAREEARTRRLEALAADRPQTIYYRPEDRFSYLGSGWGYGPGYPGYRPPHRPPHPGYPGYPEKPEPPEPPAERSRGVPLPPLKRD